ncbi:MAG: four helix bundle protein [Bacteroidales bacterium]
MDIEDLEVYQLAMKYAEEVYAIVIKWDSFNKYSLGQQWIDAADSIGANISEGFGRYHYKDNKRFCYFSRGSLSECKTWCTKAYNRNLISEEIFIKLKNDKVLIYKKLNSYINSIGRKMLP